MDNKTQIELPILSICIPTYNRAKKLESALDSITPQVKKAEREVELIVSDNCSSDNTKEVVERARKKVPISYYRNPQNEGAARNVLKLTNELAKGKFAWILADDDLVRPDGIERVLNILKKYPKIDYVFVNVTALTDKDRNSFNRPVSALDFPNLQPAKSKDLGEHFVERWEELLDPAIDSVFLGSIMCSVFRISRWKKYRLKLNMTDKMFVSLEQTYPHACILAHTMIGRKAYYLGYPCIIAFHGEQEWIGGLPLIITVRLHELLDLYQKLGVDVNRVERCRSQLLSYSSAYLSEILLNPDAYGREYFSLRKFLIQNRNHINQLRVIFDSVICNFFQRY